MDQMKPKWNAQSIRELRKSRGLTQAQFAEALGCRQQTISEWELDMYAPKNAYQRLLDLYAGSSGQQSAEISTAERKAF